jgi:replicative DNA helicase
MAALKSGKGVLIFSLEMSAIQLLMRMAAAITHIEFSRIKDNKLDERELKEVEDAYDYINSLPIEIDETASLNIYAARAKARAYKKKLAGKGIELGLIMSDYLQLYTATLKNKSGNREQEVAAISRGHKSMAKENDVAVIALSQLSRSVETRGGNKRPFLSDLRESGQIEQDADMVQMLYRAEYYNIVEDEDGNSTIGLMDIIIAKHRNGELGDVKVRTMFEYCDITNHTDLYVSETNPNIITGDRKEPNDDIPF